MSRGPQDSDEDAVLSDQTRDDTDRGWGEDLRTQRSGASGREADRDEWLRREVPPHHGS